MGRCLRTRIGAAASSRLNFIRPCVSEAHSPRLSHCEGLEGEGRRWAWFVERGSGLPALKPQQLGGFGGRRPAPRHSQTPLRPCPLPARSHAPSPRSRHRSQSSRTSSKSSPAGSLGGVLGRGTRRRCERRPPIRPARPPPPTAQPPGPPSLRPSGTRTQAAGRGGDDVVVGQDHCGVGRRGGVSFGLVGVGRAGGRREGRAASTLRRPSALSLPGATTHASCWR